MVEREAANIIALTQTESAIKGGINTPLVGDNIGDFAGITPQRQVGGDALDARSMSFSGGANAESCLGHTTQ